METENGNFHFLFSDGNPVGIVMELVYVGNGNWKKNCYVEMGGNWNKRAHSHIDLCTVMLYGKLTKPKLYSELSSIPRRIQGVHLHPRPRKKSKILGA